MLGKTIQKKKCDKGLIKAGLGMSYVAYVSYGSVLCRPVRNGGFDQMSEEDVIGRLCGLDMSLLASFLPNSSEFGLNNLTGIDLEMTLKIQVHFLTLERDYG